MTNITVKPVHCSAKVEVTRELVHELRAVQQRGISFHAAWKAYPTFQEVGLSRSQALCLWELTRLGEAPCNSDYETIIRLQCRCDIERGGIAWIEFIGTDFRFTPKDRWLIGLSDSPNYQYLHMAVRAIRRL